MGIGRRYSSFSLVVSFIAVQISVSWLDFWLLLNTVRAVKFQHKTKRLRLRLCLSFWTLSILMLVCACLLCAWTNHLFLFIWAKRLPKILKKNRQLDNSTTTANRRRNSIKNKRKRVNNNSSSSNIGNCVSINGKVSKRRAAKRRRKTLNNDGRTHIHSIAGSTARIPFTMGWRFIEFNDVWK